MADRPPVAEDGLHPVRRAGRGAAWRSLGVFWGVVVLALAIGGGTLQVLGPPAAPPHPSPPPAPVVAASPAIPPPVVLHPTAQAAPPGGPGRSTPGPITDPDPALLQPAPDEPGRKLPRIADDGRKPMQLYAAGFDPSSRRPRVGLLLAGIGLDHGASEQAIRLLPGGVTLAISPYAHSVEPLLAQARLSEHEYLLSIPMEPPQYPLNDPGPHALTTRATPEDNARQLQWALSRFQGYVGATGALGLTRGERLAAVADEMGPVLRTLGADGLLYVDPRPGAERLPFVWSRAVDVVIDEPDDSASIGAKLAELDRIAAEKGSALGLAGAPRSATVERIAAWANELEAKGLVLAPVSALAGPPAAAVAGQ